MPRVSQEYREARRREILEAAGRCFARSGFHSTSMQELFDQSGLTAGLVYRYFKTKDELIAAIAAEALDMLNAAVEEALSGRAPYSIEDVIGRLLQTVEVLDDRQQLTRVVVQAWGEALLNPAVGPVVTGGFAKVRQSLEVLVRRAQAAGWIDRETDPGYAARVLFSVIPGFIVQRALDPPLDRGAYERAARSLVRGQLVSREHHE